MVHLRPTLEQRVSRTYGYFLDRVVRVSVNLKTVAAVDIQFRENTSADLFKVEDVSCSVIAGIVAPTGKFYSSESSGWYVFCNGRAVAFADKGSLTGWGVFLPSWQPKHRPFAGLVFFTAEDPERLPWTTTKSSINQESAVWQHALRVMGAVGKQITSFLDTRYSSDGTDISTDDLANAGGRSSSVLQQVSQTVKRTFAPPKIVQSTTSIQFTVDVTQLESVKKYLGRRTMSNGEVGRHMFDYFLKNVVE